MNRDDLLELCAGKPEAAEKYPFGDAVAVFKVADRTFALITLAGDPGTVTLKCEPGLAQELRARFAAVQPGYHMNKRHWNTAALDGSVDNEELLEMVEDSYQLVARRRQRD